MELCTRGLHKELFSHSHYGWASKSQAFLLLWTVLTVNLCKSRKEWKDSLGMTCPCKEFHGAWNTHIIQMCFEGAKIISRAFNLPGKRIKTLSMKRGHGWYSYRTLLPISMRHWVSIKGGLQLLWAYAKMQYLFQKQIQILFLYPVNILLRERCQQFTAKCLTLRD